MDQDQKNYKMRIIKWWPLVFLIFLPTAIKFPCFSSKVIGLLCFLFVCLFFLIPRYSSFSVIQVNKDIKI